jgi:very-short-patch-repair endonuclease
VGSGEGFGALLARQDNVASRDQVIEHVGRAVMRNRLTQGRWQQAACGVVVAHNGPITERQTLWIAVLAAGPGAVCAGLTAAALQSFRGYPPPAVDLLLPQDRRVRLGKVPGVRLHRTGALPTHHVHHRARPPRTTLARAIVDAAGWASCDDDARALVAAAFQQRLVADFELTDVLAVLTRTPRRGLIRETMNLAKHGAHAISELELVRICRRYGLPVPDQQVRRDGRYLDAYWHEWRLHVEVDGRWHIEVKAWWADMRRQNDLWIAGDRVLRFPAWVVLHRPEEVAAQLRRALLAAGWRPTDHRRAK